MAIISLVYSRQLVDFSVWYFVLLIGPSHFSFFLSFSLFLPLFAILWERVWWEIQPSGEIDVNSAWNWERLEKKREEERRKRRRKIVAECERAQRSESQQQRRGGFTHTHIHTERDWLQYADQRRRVNRALFPLVLPLYPALSFSRAPVFRSVSTGATKSLALIYPNLDF